MTTPATPPDAQQHYAAKLTAAISEPGLPEEERQRLQGLLDGLPRKPANGNGSARLSRDIVESGLALAVSRLEGRADAAGLSEADRLLLTASGVDDIARDLKLRARNGDVDGADREPTARRAPTIFAPVPVARLYDQTSETVEWLWHELIPVGGLVLLAAFMKAGKSTLAYALLAAILRGRPFLDRETRASRVMVLALEESARDVKRRLLKFDVDREAGLFLQFRPVPTAPAEWSALVDFVRRERIGLLVIDTLSRCWPTWGVDNENDNAKVAAALAPILDLCRDSHVTVLALHHTGKLTEGHGREVRGAGAILALADQALLFDRYRAGDPCDRVLRVLGRYDESPHETLMRYSKATGTYEVLREEERSEEARGAEVLYPQLLAYLRRVGATGATLRGIRQNVTGARNATKDRAAEQLVSGGQTVLRDGRFYHVAFDPQEASK